MPAPTSATPASAVSASTLDVEILTGAALADALLQPGRVVAWRAGSQVKQMLVLPAMIRFHERILRVSRRDAPLLLTGESGTGKDLYASLVHALSPRSQGPCGVLDCATLMRELAHSDAFGHRKGSYSGSVADRLGRIPAANGGNLLLHEVGELDGPLQAMLLRLLAEGRFAPLGDDRDYDVDVRIVSTTNRDLDAEIVSGRFRRDCFMRLSALLETVPPLRSRPGDLLPLFLRLLEEKSGSAQAWRVEPAAAELLKAHPWPGNVRELQNVAERMVTHLPRDARVVTEAGLVAEGRLFRPAVTPEAASAVGNGAAADELRHMCARLIRRALRRSNGVMGAAAKRLDVSHRLLARLSAAAGVTVAEKARRTRRPIR